MDVLCCGVLVLFTMSLFVLSPLHVRKPTTGCASSKQWGGGFLRTDGPMGGT